MQTTAGSLALVGSHPAKDSFVAQKLREAGAVILGKTNLSEWANIRSSHSVSGWSGRGGLTRNPYALDRNPCGSSSGSGAATAANLCALAVGTETDGSVVCPSSANGIVGIKPTLGLISRSGIIPIAHSQDTAGPMARTVRDAAILLSALAGRRSARQRDRSERGKDRRRLHAAFSIPTDCAARASAWRASISASATAWIALMDERDGRDEAAGRGAGRSRRPRDSRQVRRQRIPGAALRTESRSQRLSGDAVPTPPFIP